MTLSCFRTNPRAGHMKQAKHVCGYLRKVPDFAIWVRTKIPNHEAYFDTPKHDWLYTVYGTDKEEIPDDMPSPKGKPVRTTSYVDANLMYCHVTGKSATGVLHLVNQTPIA